MPTTTPPPATPWAGPLRREPRVGLDADGSDLAPHVSLPWLARLRWGAFAGQCLTLLVASRVLGVELPALPLGVLVALTALSNLALELGLRLAGPPARPRWILGAVLLLDTLLLTGLLYESGGPTNPFSVLYLVHVTLAAVALPAAWTWSLTVLSVASYGFLFWKHVPLTLANGCALSCDYDLHLEGMWVALAIAAAFVCVFVGKVVSALRRTEAALAGIREQALRNERLVSLATLAAGAAHELGTPLGTIAVVSRELELAAAKLPPGEGTAIGEDARLIRGQVDRCRAILDRLGTRGAPGAEGDRVAFESLLAELREGLPPGQVERLRVSTDAAASRSPVPRLPLLQALGALVQNAFDAMGETGTVLLAASIRSDRLSCSVEDTGAGMSAETLARAGEPFFTTKEPGQGMGLGLFLSRIVAEGIGGELHLESRPGLGTRVTLELPAAGAARA